VRARELVPVGLLAVIIAVTAAWWALALWPLPESAPAWLARARWVCFNAPPEGLPNGGGWLLLVAQPLSMIGALLVVWGDGLRQGLGRCAATPLGRSALLAVAAALLVGVGATGVRVARAADRPAAALPPPGPIETYPRIDRAAPPLSLIDQHGDAFTLARFHGRPVIVTFAFAHCTAICPLVVQDALRARDLAADLAPALVVITLDPWRDPPERLGAIAAQWRLTGDAVALSGSVEAVEAVLDDWRVGRSRDPVTGDVVHPPLVYVVNRDGRIAYAAAGDAATIAALISRADG